MITMAVSSDDVRETENLELTHWLYSLIVYYTLQLICIMTVRMNSSTLSERLLFPFSVGECEQQMIECIRTTRSLFSLLLSDASSSSSFCSSAKRLNVYCLCRSRHRRVVGGMVEKMLENRSTSRKARRKRKRKKKNQGYPLPLDGTTNMTGAFRIKQHETMRSWRTILLLYRRRRQSSVRTRMFTFSLHIRSRQISPSNHSFTALLLFLSIEKKRRHARHLVYVFTQQPFFGRSSLSCAGMHRNDLGEAKDRLLLSAHTGVSNN